MTTTDRDRIKEVFRTLRLEGIAARMNFMCCNSCAIEGLTVRYGEDAEIIYWHEQDDEAFADDGDLTDTLYVRHSGKYAPHVAVFALRQAGFTVTWDGSTSHCIEVSK